MRKLQNLNYEKKTTIRAMTFIAFFILFTFNLIFCENQLLSKINNNCIWIKHDSIIDSSKVDSLISFINKNKINKVFLETFTNGEFKYNPSNSIKEDSILNELKYLSSNIKNDNVKLYAWIDAYKIWDKNFYPINPEHFYYQCPDCLEADLNSRSDKLIKLDKVQSLEWEGIFLSPIHPESNKYILNTLNSIKALYIYDGVVIDYIRYQNYYYGYNPLGLEIFENKYNFNPLDLNRGIISKRFGYNDSEVDSLNLLWDNYRRDAITDLLYQFKNQVNQDSVSFEIITAVKSSPFDSINKWYQDWPRWINENLVDYVIIKNNALKFYDFNYNNSIIKKIYAEYDYLEKIIIGMNLYEINPINIGNKILYLRLNGFDNISLYLYNEYKNIVNWYSPIYKAINFNLSND
ncbi:MAG: hypothetical protein CMG66_03195 [Candidatus Marinimicrobia bacterium]|nr:hypothetical protein [Candidatus Neomarinimicrobiota bacterium]|tara:strand:- start:54930 stop:56147 length:1218 start_codon:yes stop_codon:yes gene_type:complete